MCDCGEMGSWEKQEQNLSSGELGSEPEGV
jgi:hypothetical protein